MPWFGRKLVYDMSSVPVMDSGGEGKPYMESLRVELEELGRRVDMEEMGWREEDAPETLWPQSASARTTVSNVDSRQGYGCSRAQYAHPAGASGTRTSTPPSTQLVHDRGCALWPECGRNRAGGTRLAAYLVWRRTFRERGTAHRACTSRGGGTSLVHSCCGGAWSEGRVRRRLVWGAERSQGRWSARAVGAGRG